MRRHSCRYTARGGELRHCATGDGTQKSRTSSSSCFSISHLRRSSCAACATPDGSIRCRSESLSMHPMSMWRTLSMYTFWIAALSSSSASLSSFILLRLFASCKCVQIEHALRMQHQVRLIEWMHARTLTVARSFSRSSASLRLCESAPSVRSLHCRADTCEDAKRSPLQCRFASGWIAVSSASAIPAQPFRAPCGACQADPVCIALKAQPVIAENRALRRKGARVPPGAWCDARWLPGCACAGPC